MNYNRGGGGGIFLIFASKILFQKYLYLNCIIQTNRFSKKTDSYDRKSRYFHISLICCKTVYSGLTKVLYLVTSLVVKSGLLAFIGKLLL